ncbi:MULTISPECIES: phage tail tape measure protein [unclassified Polaromonas]|jgi:hypothetical protein|uniref:phage tail tape measure protein n=1 Tax=unclassified Polaromonas TaxID=2638319 RepID=UPI000BD63A43|nr:MULTISPECIES: phage tail tape measure protein [unclassified Polaromonas]OYY34581.1 MAG: hypothetical protein B7Y60_16000 [Polaromonas sp. 35-63-35]OYZ15070.1 MAG: hypothetical protein B7Y28_22640 [Polaromonas sp. 16-63-31]OYZ78859.1 MAG: hypothetical protein B7Y09_11290 [Polaromonas sp. 24-63-21]OZA49627.1 MAG: hypothetical protein B7X88_14540 [Polaromonas sp. 17-63-33]OZA86829.1 MAG: hypothetical protein B7X65_15280 [Polaromonas sp. 39-63-25]
MTQDLRIALTTSLNDQLVGPLRRALDEIEKNLKKVEQELTGVAQKSDQAGRALAGLQGPDRAAKQVADLARNTQNAVSMADRLKAAWAGAGNMMRGVTTGIASYQAAKYVVAAPMQQARSYDRQLADAANTAFSSRDVAGRRAGMADLDATVTNSLRAGGGSRDQALAALNEMLASGSVSADQAKGLLPTVAKYATAGNASMTEISTIVVRALQSGFKEADIPKMLDMALDAGQRGGFELKDMAKWLPKLLAAGSMSGLGGMDGYARILASAQGTVTTTGTKDQAGNALLNLLLKINSSDTANDAKKMGIDLAGSLSDARGKGVNSLDAFVNLVDQIAGRDSRMVDLRKKAVGAGTNEERKATYNAQADILQGSAIGKIVQDREALLAVVAELNKRDYIQGISKGVLGGNGQLGNTNFGLISSTADFKVGQQENEKLFAQTRALDSANGALGKLAEVATAFYREYPAFTSVVEAAKLSIMALAAASAAASVAQLVAGGGSMLGLLKGAGAGIAGVGGAAMTALGAAGTGSAAALAAGAAGVGIAGAAGYGAGTLISKGIEGTSVHDEIGKLAAAVMATLGSKDAQEALDRMAEFDGKRSAEAAATMQRLEAVAQRPIRVVLDGREISAQVNSYNELFIRRN